MPVVASQKSSDGDLTQAAEKASLVIRDLQSKLRQRPPAEIAPDDLENQLAQYFTKIDEPRGPLSNEFRNRVIDALVDRILRDWEQGGSLEGAVFERLIDRLMDRLGEASH